MGVPAFYRWLIEKYPKIVEKVEEECPSVIEGELDYSTIDIENNNPNGKEYDNLYIDMNGLIHPCAHPENGEQPKTEAHMYLNVMRYVDRLVAAVRPRKLLYLAIDGVAPRAKMNQQRSRRFRSAQEAEEQLQLTRDAKEYMKSMGHHVPEEVQAWDSNVITPGTSFMEQLSKFLHFYIRDRLNNVAGWKDLKVVLSDASVPGEGEHKIMAYIRQQRCQEGYDPNVRHVLHGLDADLIMLALATHEAHFTILREEVLFGKQKYEAMERKKRSIAEMQRGEMNSSVNPEDHGMKPLVSLKVSTLREYLQFDFSCLESVPFGYDFERVVDDFIFLCFFVGNDFLPHLPCLDIRDGALDFLVIIYKKLLPTLGGYLSDSGEICLHRVDKILQQIGLVENEIFRRKLIKEQREKNRKIQQQRRNKAGGKARIAANAAVHMAVPIVKRNRNANESAAAALKQSLGDNSTAISMPNEEESNKYIGMSAAEAIKARVKEKEQAKLDKYQEDIEDTVKLGEPGWKQRYYQDKCKSEDIAHGGGREKVFLSYIEGLCWIMKYYYNGCASWEWFYPFHYAPFASDLENIDRFNITFKLGKPFKPFEQLMGVFPAASGHALPEQYRGFMKNQDSPIIDFYPTVIPVDPNGKAMPWLWVVLLPFIDQGRLKDALTPLESTLSSSEKRRNRRRGKELLFFHTSNPLHEFISTDSTIIELDMNKTHTFSGTLKNEPVKSVHIDIGKVVEAPKCPPGAFVNIPENQAYCFEYQMPPAIHHRSVLLEGAALDPPALSEKDSYISIPKLSRDLSIIDLAGGAPSLSQGNYQAPPPRHFNQYLAEGHRNWGSLEPRRVDKRNVRPRTQGYNNPPPPPIRPQTAYAHQAPRPSYSQPRHANAARPSRHVGRPSRGRGHSAHPPRVATSSGNPIQSVFGVPQDRYKKPSTGPTLDALKAGLRGMHQNRGTLPNGTNNKRYDRR